MRCKKGQVHNKPILFTDVTDRRWEPVLYKVSRSWRAALKKARSGDYVLVDYFMKTRTGSDYSTAAARFAAATAEAMAKHRGTNTDRIVAVGEVYHVDPERQVVKIAYPARIFGSSIPRGGSLLPPAWGNGGGAMLSCLVARCTDCMCSLP